jgi:hypothetical protein
MTACASRFAHYIFVRARSSLRMTPAMAAGIAQELWPLSALVSRLEVRVEPDVRKALLIALRLLLGVQKRLIDLDLRTRALQVVLAQATGVDPKSAEGHLQKIVESLRSAEVDAANEEASAMLDFLEMGKEPDGSDA